MKSKKSNFRKFLLFSAALLCLAFISLNEGSNFDNNVNISEAQTVPINLGTNGCVCKGASCQDQNWVSFRPYCGYGDGSDAYCAYLGGDICD